MAQRKPAHTITHHAPNGAKRVTEFYIRPDGVSVSARTVEHFPDGSFATVQNYYRPEMGAGDPWDRAITAERECPWRVFTREEVY